MFLRTRALLCALLVLCLTALPVCAKPRSGRKAAAIGVVFATGGDDSMYAASKEALTRAQANLRVRVTNYLAGYDPAGYDQAVRDAATQNTLVIAVGSALLAPVEKCADAYPDVDFVLIDAKSSHPRVTSVVFYQHEAAYLAGVLAVRVAERNPAAPGTPGKVGIILGDNGEKFPVMLDFLSGFAQGAQDASPRTEVLQASVQSWNDRAKAKRTALEMRKRGATAIFQAAGQSGLGVIDAALEKRFYIIGVDEAQEKLAPGYVLTAVLKHFDTALYDVICAKYDGHLRPGSTLTYRLWNRGVGLSWTTNSLMPEDLRRELEGISYRIIDGHIKVRGAYDAKGFFKKDLKKIPAQGISIAPKAHAITPHDLSAHGVAAAFPAAAVSHVVMRC